MREGGPHHLVGEVTEWSKVHDWKSCVPKGTGGSNPFLSATRSRTITRGSAAPHGPANAGPQTPPGPEGSNGSGHQRVAGPPFPSVPPRASDDFGRVGLAHGFPSY